VSPWRPPDVDHPSNKHKPRKGGAANQDKKMYQCQIDITFPTPQHALQAKEVLEVDRELGDQITKSFQVTTCTHGSCANSKDKNCKETRSDTGTDTNPVPESSSSAGAAGENGKIEHGGEVAAAEGGGGNVLSIHFRATEAKSLRVAISSFYDMLNIYLKCHQEFS